MGEVTFVCGMGAAGVEEGGADRQVLGRVLVRTAIGGTRSHPRKELAEGISRFQRFM